MCAESALGNGEGFGKSSTFGEFLSYVKLLLIAGGFRYRPWLSSAAAARLQPRPEKFTRPAKFTAATQKKAEKDIFHLIFLFLKTTEKDKNNLLRNDGGLSYLSNYEKLEP